MGREARVEREEPKGNNWREQLEQRALFYQSPGRSADGPAVPVIHTNENGERKLSGVGFRTGQTLIVFTDGSFRGVTVRRPAGLSGRQRNNYRKHARRVAKLANKPIERVGPSARTLQLQQAEEQNVNNNQE